ncbi:MAG: hypothetical protein KGV44_02135 [Flavobacteriaceae bacterium]|nr:hypothetical protein [Flavobacteriaceae bacterium]
MAINKTEVSLEEGKTVKVNITAGSGNYTVTSSNDKKATVTEKNGVVTVTAKAEGTAVVTIKDNKTGQTKTVKVTITAKTPDLAINKTEVSLEEGNTVNVNITSGSGNYTVTSSNTNKATVTEENGVITITAVGDGDVTITVKDNKTRQTKTIKVTITTKTPNLAIDKTEVSLEVGKTETIIITAGSGNYTITSNDNKKATVIEQNGIITIKATEKGIVVVTVTDISTKQTKQLKVNIKTVDLIVNKEEIEVVSDEFTQTLIEITSGSGDYKITSDNEKIAHVAIKDIHIFYIETKKKQGSAIITIKDNKTNQIKTVKVTVKEKQLDLSTYIELTTEKNIGETIELIINANEEDRKNVWIDLNDNGKKDSGEAVTSSKYSKVSYTLGSRTIRLYGKVAYLICGSNKLIQLNISNNTGLTDLGVQGNQLTSLDVSNNTQLKYLNCDNNKLTQLNVSNNTKLKTLFVQSNQLTSLDVSHNLQLRELYCATNQLISLDITNNTQLSGLYCDRNQLTSLNISNNRELRYLECKSNQLTSLDVSNNTQLLYLECKSNQLTSLDIRSNTQLKSLNSDNNQLVQLNVFNNRKLKDLFVQGNQLKSLDISHLSELGKPDKNGYKRTFNCSKNTNLTCIKVSQEQLDTLKDRNWKKDDAATYNTNCN